MKLGNLRAATLVSQVPLHILLRIPQVQASEIEKAKQERKAMADLQRLVQQHIGQDTGPSHDPFGGRRLREVMFDSSRVLLLLLLCLVFGTLATSIITAEVIESVSSDSLVIQDAISEKVPVFVMNLSTFVGSYVAAFIILWRLAIAGFPFVIFLLILGLMYGRALMSIARKIRDEYNKIGSVVEQALSNITNSKVRFSDILSSKVEHVLLNWISHLQNPWSSLCSLS